MQKKSTNSAINPGASRMKPVTDNMDVSPNAPVPAGLTVENLRRRGIDLLRIQVGDTRSSGIFGRLFGGSGSKKPGATITIVDEQMRFDNLNPKTNRAETAVAAFNDIEQITVGAHGLSAKSALRVSFDGTVVELGTGLSEAALYWLRERLLLEKAGLVWKPLYNVGRRTTRKTTNPDDDQYANWPDGSNRLVTFFLQEAPDKSRNLLEAINAQAWEKAQQHAHWLKSSSAVVGAAYLSELCQRMEIDIQTADYSRIGVLAPHFSKEFQKVIQILSRLSEPQVQEVPAASEAEPKTEEAPIEPLLKDFRILLVEDSKVNQELARDCLEPTGCKLSVSSNGQAAIELHDKEKFDAILMDCQMPGMNGFEATKAIRSREVLAMVPRVPIIALTANALRDDRDVCISAGMDDYVSKPYMPHEIIDVLLKWLPEKAPGSENADEQVEALKDVEIEMRAATAEKLHSALPEDQPLQAAS